MQRSFDPGISEELVKEAILQLQHKNLVKTSGTPSQASRRQFITTMSGIALPLVVSLSIVEQRAYAQKYILLANPETRAEKSDIFSERHKMQATLNCCPILLRSRTACPTVKQDCYL